MTHRPRSHPIHLGVVGSLGRGRFALDPLVESQLGLRVHALCDLDADRLRAQAASLPSWPSTWTSYVEMLDKAGLDAVLIATPMPLHVPQAIAALRRGLHVLSEVPAGVSVEECRELVRACRERPDVVYMLAENLCYYRPVQIVTEMARRGLFGTTYYAEGEYLHEIKELFVRTPWRRAWQGGINGITYGTHSLGPILRWMPGDRVVAVSCAGSGRHYRDAEGRPFEMEDTCVMLCRMRSGGLVKVRLDFISNRPSRLSCHRFVLQGTEGIFEASHLMVDPHRVWLASRAAGGGGGKGEWREVEEFAEEFLPQRWRRLSDTATGAGHGGSDLVQLLDFADAVRTGMPPPIGIHEAMDMTLPGLASQRSIAEGGRWVEVEDSRAW